jgi:hypothetical protein
VEGTPVQGIKVEGFLKVGIGKILFAGVGVDLPTLIQRPRD